MAQDTQKKNYKIVIINMEIVHRCGAGSSMHVCHAAD